MRRVYEIYKYIDSIAPFCSAESWDNPGLLVGDASDEINKAVICLDIDKGAADFAKQTGAQLLISHHPVIFDPLKRLGKENCVYHLVQNHMAAICAHTNLDCAHDGVSDTLAQRLELTNIHVPDDHSRDALFLRCGALKEAMQPETFAQYVKEHLACEGLRFVCGTRLVKNVMVCGGAGGSFLENVMQLKADAYVTGDVKHDVALSAQNAGFTLVDAGHFDTEKWIVEKLYEKLRQAFLDVEFVKYIPQAPMHFL